MQSTHRRKLNQKQLDTLELLYRFRFLTTGLLTRLESRKHITIAYSRLRILNEAGYIGRHYDGDKQIRGEYATYYIKQKGVSALKDHLGEDFVPRVGKNLVRDEHATELFIKHWLLVLDLYCSIKERYSDADFFTKNELSHEKYNYFMNSLPDGYVDVAGAHFFVDYIDASALYFKLTKRVKDYVAYCDSKVWDATGTTFPAVLLICATSADQKRLLKKLPFMTGQVAFYTAIASEIQNLDPDEDVFTTIDGPASLTDLISSSLADG